MRPVTQIDKYKLNKVLNLPKKAQEDLLTRLTLERLVSLFSEPAKKDGAR